MDTQKFIEKAIKMIMDYYMEELGHKYSEVDVYNVWNCKTLQNNKGLFSTTIQDKRYMEVTYNGDKDEMYLDVYVKEKNICDKEIRIKTR